MKTIAIIDKHPIACWGISYILKELFREAKLLQSQSINSFYKIYPKENPELIILSVGQTPEANNIRDVKKARKLYTSSDLIVYDEELDIPNVPSYLNAGVSGYISKQEKASKLVTCIMDVVSGNQHVLL